MPAAEDIRVAYCSQTDTLSIAFNAECDELR